MPCCEWSERFAVSVVMSLFAIFIFIYGKFRSLNPTYKDPFMKSLGMFNLDGWSLIHVLSYTALGFNYSGCDLEVIGFGALWEAFEFFLGKKRPAWLGGFGDHPNNINAVEHKDWWHGRWSDLLMNAIGFYSGSYFG